MKIVENLTPEWIMQILSRDPVRAVSRQSVEEDIDQTAGIAMGRSNSAGEQVDILNPIDMSAQWDEDFKMTDTMPSSKMSLEIFVQDASRRRKLVLHGSLAQTTQSRHDDIAVQEQTFDLLRNLTCGDHATEMIDYLFKEMGQNELLDIIAEALRPRTIQLPRRETGSQANQTLRIPKEIIIAVSALLIHLAAGHPRHRRAVTFHRSILPHLANYLNHPNIDVRRTCVWVTINLAFEEDQNDFEGCRERAIRLRSLGFGERLTALQDDVDLDIRERIKVVLHFLNRLAPSS
jgi:hypothetical protein